MDDQDLIEHQGILADIAAVHEVKRLLLADAQLDELISRFVLSARLSAGKAAEIMLHVAACRSARAPFLSAITAQQENRHG